MYVCGTEAEPFGVVQAPFEKVNLNPRISLAVLAPCFAMLAPSLSGVYSLAVTLLLIPVLICQEGLGECESMSLQHSLGVLLGWCVNARATNSY